MSNARRTIAVDFDGVIHAYTAGWCDGQIYDPPVVGVRAGLKKLQAEGFFVVVYSCRANSPGLLREMTNWLDKQMIPYDDIWSDTGKPAARMYIDDRAWSFVSWSPEVVDQIIQRASREDDK